MPSHHNAEQIHGPIAAAEPPRKDVEQCLDEVLDVIACHAHALPAEVTRAIRALEFTLMQIECDRHSRRVSSANCGVWLLSDENDA